MKITVYEPIDLQHIDKLQHSLAYFILSTSWLFALQKKQRKYVIVICCIFFGIVLEILQYAITNYRTGEYLDVLANSFGVILGVFVFNQVSKKNRLKNEKTSN
jgi:VanZ family protein